MYKRQTGAGTVRKEKKMLYGMFRLGIGFIIAIVLFVLIKYTKTIYKRKCCLLYTSIISDKYNSEFEPLISGGESRGQTYTTYYAHIPNFDSSYSLTVNGTEIVLQKP